MQAVNGTTAESLVAGTPVEVETVSGSYRGMLIKPHHPGTDVELRCAGHYVRVHWLSVHRVRALGRTMQPR
jgi:hypothetical protein